jgi:hypothetical protein
MTVNIKATKVIFLLASKFNKLKAIKRRLNPISIIKYAIR